MQEYNPRSLTLQVAGVPEDLWRRWRRFLIPETGRTDSMQSDVKLTTQLVAVGGDSAGEISSRVLDAISVANTLQITDQDGMASAASLITQIATYKTRVEKLRKELVLPHRNRVQEIDDLFRQLSDPLSKASSSLETKIMGYRAELRRKAQEEEDKRQRLAAMKQKLLDQGKIQAVIVPAPIPAPDPDLNKTLRVSGGGAITTREDWVFEITDPLLVPRMYLQVNEVSVRLAVKSGERTIPGVRIFLEESLVKRGRRDV